MWHKERLFQMLISVLLLRRASAESRIYTGGYGFGAPINVGGESAYSLGSSLSSSGLSNGLNTLSGLNSLSGLHNNFGLSNSGSSGLGFGLATGNYPSLHNFNNFQQNPYAQSAGNFYPNTNFAGSFYPGGGGYFGQNFAGYGIQRPFQLGNGIGNFGLQSSNGLQNGLNNVLSSSYPLGVNGFTGLGNNFAGFNNYGGSPFGNGLGFGSQQHFK